MCRRRLLIVALFCTCYAPAAAAPRSDRNPIPWRILTALNQNVDYLVRAYKEINKDCLLGVALARGILEDISPHYFLGSNIANLTKKIDHLYDMSLNYLKKASKDIWALDYIIQPSIWKRNISFGHSHLGDDSVCLPGTTEISNIFLSSHNIEKYAKFSDKCLQNLVQETADLGRKFCHLNSDCQAEFMENEDTKPGYLGTHKLLYLQIAKQRNCILDDKIYATKARSICNYILCELTSIDHYGYFGTTFDLALEQIALCGTEGYLEFLKTKWLTWILQTQTRSGCFPASFNSNNQVRLKRTINEWADGCADHTTGLGTAVLSLYLNFWMKSEQ